MATILNYIKCIFCTLLVLFCPLFSNSADIHTSILDLSPIKFTYPNISGLRFGERVSAIGDFDGDQNTLDFAIGAPGVNDSLSDKGSAYGAVFIVYGDQLKKDISRIGLNQPNKDYPFIDLSHPDSGTTRITGTNEYPIGSSIAGTHDINQDGFSDFAIGTSNHSSGFILYGTQTRGIRISVDSINEKGIQVMNTGLSSSSAGDFNGDQYPDVIFGNPSSEIIKQNDRVLHYGTFTLLFGSNEIPSILQPLIPSTHYFQDRGTPNSFYAQHVSGSADINQDGYSDIIITAANNQTHKTGSAYLIYGSNDPFQKDNTGYSLIIDSIVDHVSFCGDVNGDSFSEIIAGMPNNESIILLGKENLNGTIDLSSNPQQWGIVIKGAERVYSVGDLNGDGFHDIAAAMPQATVGSQVMTGEVLIIFGSNQMPKEIDIHKIRNNQFTPVDYIFINGLNAFDNFGASIAGIGDIQNDGFDDVVIGAPSIPLPGDTIQTNPGTVYLLNGIDLYYALQTQRSKFSLGGKKK